MVTVLTTFYHPDLGAVRGTVIDGVPMLSCRKTANLLGCYDIEETENAMRRFYITRDITVPVGVDDHGNGSTENLLFIDAVAVLRLIECSACRSWEKYACWFIDFVFPSLRQLGAATEITEEAHAFYWECAEPKEEKPVGWKSDELFRLFK